MLHRLSIAWGWPATLRNVLRAQVLHNRKHSKLRNFNYWRIVHRRTEAVINMLLGSLTDSYGTNKWLSQVPEYVPRKTGKGTGLSFFFDFWLSTLESHRKNLQNQAALSNSICVFCQGLMRFFNVLFKITVAVFFVAKTIAFYSRAHALFHTFLPSIWISTSSFNQWSVGSHLTPGWIHSITAEKHLVSPDIPKAFH